MAVRLTLFGGALSGIVMQMSSSRFLIGRGKDCVLRASSPTVSRHHCVLLRDESGLRIKDLDSTNGTYINGRRISGEVPLRHGDMVTVGEVTLQVDLSELDPKTKGDSPTEMNLQAQSDTVSFPIPDKTNFSETTPVTEIRENSR